MKIVTLLENTTLRDDLTPAHGLSLYIETGNQKILFDAGPSPAFAENAEKLGVDLSAMDFAVLSHGHYDHGGGLLRFLELNRRAPVYVSPFAFEPHYNAAGKDIGLDPALRSSPRLVPVSEPLSPAPGIALFPTVPTPIPPRSDGLTATESGIPATDSFRHEQYLLVEEEGMRVLFSGCSHRGICNIAAHFRPDVLIGGFHFMKITDEETLSLAADTLLSLPIRYYTGHCTGQPQYEFLKQKLGDRLNPLSTGSILTLH